MALMCIPHRGAHLQLVYRDSCLEALGDLTGVRRLGLLALWGGLLLGDKTYILQYCLS